MKKGLIALLAIVMILTLALSACSSTTEPTPTPTPAAEKISGKLVVWTWDGHLTKDVENFKAAFPDVELDVQVLPGFFTKIKQALTTGVGLPDVIMVENGQYGEFAQNRLFEDLYASPYNAAELKDQFMEFWWNNGESLTGELRVFPRAPGMGVAFYRRDVAKAVFGTDVPEELEALLPNLEAVIAKSAEFNTKKGAGATIMPGADGIFALALKQQGTPLYDAATNAFDANRLKAPFELALKAKAAGIKATSATFWDDMKAGNFLFYTDGSWGEAYTLKAGLGVDEATGKPNQNGQWGIMNTPGGNVNIGGNGLALLATSKNKAAGWAFIKSLATDTEVAVNYLKEVAVFPSLLAAANEADFSLEDEFLGGQKASLKIQELAKTTISFKVTPYDAAIQGVINKYVGSVLDGTMTTADAIQKIADEVRSEVGITTTPAAVIQ